MKRILFASVICLLLLTSGCGEPPSQPALPTWAPTITLPTETQVRQPPTAESDQTGPNLPDSDARVWIANPADRTVLRIDPAGGEVTAIQVDGEPGLAVAGEGSVWILDRINNLVFKINPRIERVVASIPLPAGRAETLAVGAGAVWVGMTGYVDLTNQFPGQVEEILPPGRVVKIDPNSNQILEELPAQPVSRLAISAATVWVLSRGIIDTPLQMYDLTKRQGMAVALQNGPAWLPSEAFAVADDSIWLFSAAHGKIFHATTDGIIFAEIPIRQNRPTGYAEMLLAQSGLWAATPWGSLIHIDPASHQIVAEMDLQTPLSGLVDGAGTVWALSQQTGQVFRIDPNRNEVTARISTGSPAQPTVVPSPTARVVIWKPCRDGPTSRLKVNDIAYVTKEPPIPNRVRQEPGREAEILGLINPGGSMTVIDGPACADGWVWWKVKNANLEGWMSEGDAESYWMIPLYK